MKDLAPLRSLSRRSLLRGGLALAAAPALAQPMPKLGFIALADRDPALIEAIRAGLRERGLTPGETVEVLERYGDGRRDVAVAGVRDLLQSGVNVFVAGGPNIARMVSELSPEAAIVVASLESLETAGVGGSVGRPDGNITGFATFGPELIGKRVELLQQVLPALSNLIVVINAANRNHPALARAAQDSARRLGLTVSHATVARMGELPEALRTARQPGVNAALFARDFLFEANRDEVVATLRAERMAAIYDERAFVLLGGLMSYAVNRTDLFRRSGEYAARILQGARPRDLPIQYPTRFEFVINLRAAGHLGLTVPPSVLISANEVIE